MGTLTNRLTIAIPPKFRERLNNAASAMEMPPAELARQALFAGLPRAIARRKKELEAIKAAAPTLGEEMEDLPF